MNKEEEEIYRKISNMKRENELLVVIYEEINELLKSGYTGSFEGNEAKGILYAIKEYENWKCAETKS